MVYVAVDVGCIECGEETRIIGIYAKREDAQSALDKAQIEQKAKWTGEHSFEVHEIEMVIK